MRGPPTGRPVVVGATRAYRSETRAAGRSAASYNRRLADALPSDGRLPGTGDRRGRPAGEAGAGRGADATDARPRPLCAAAPGAGGPAPPARPGRPPSRRRSRPRATGMSGRGASHRARAAQALMSAGKGTCVRKLCTTADGTGTNVRARWPCRRRMAPQSRYPRIGLQRKLHPRGRRAPVGYEPHGDPLRRQGDWSPTRTGLSRWLLRLPGVRPVGPSWAEGDAHSSWRSSSSKAGPRFPAR